MKWSNYIAAIVLIILCVVVAIIFGYIATKRTLTGLESVLLQSFSVGAGLIGSYIFGKQSAREAAKEIIKPHARSAFRRLLSLFQSLSRVAKAIEQHNQSPNDFNADVTIAKLEAIVAEQLATADDALEDWRDIVPDDVEELRQRLIEKEKSEA